MRSISFSIAVLAFIVVGGCDSDNCPDPDDSKVHYAVDSHENPDNCFTIDLVCGEGQTPFDNECGCGCIDDE